MTNPQALRDIIEKERPHLVVHEIEAIATEVLLQVEAEGITTVVPTARAVHLTMNREGIRRLAAETLGLPTSKYRFASSLEALHATIDGSDYPTIGYPCIVKPVMSSSGKGQSVVSCADEIAHA
jgi:phosphoribosylglycinamide formyltransferase 2